MYRLPLGNWVSDGVDWLTATFGGFFDSLSNLVSAAVTGVQNGLEAVPWWLIIIIFIILAWRSGGWRLVLGTGIGLILIYDLQLWQPFLQTLVLVLFAALISIAVGVPVGIAAARSARVHKVLAPILDLMQTMPSFVYLIPAIMLFNIGSLSSIFAIVIFAVPPAIRLTDLGIRQVPADLVEVGKAFGSTPRQLLWKIQLPLALPTIMAGVNQTLMLSLSMVVIAAMIGAPGLGQGVLAGIAQLDVGKGFENGLAVVILAMVLDRLSQGVIRTTRASGKQK